MITEIRKVFLQNATNAGKAGAEKFVPGADDAYGVRLPVINELAKKYKTGGLKLAEELWKGKYEEKLLAGKIIGHVAKQDPPATLKLIKKLSGNINDWAVCDTLGQQGTKKIAASHTEELFKLSGELIRSKDLWQRRLAIVLIEWHTREKKHHAKIKSLLNKVRNDKEYYVKKAVSWIERNLEKKR